MAHSVRQRQKKSGIYITRNKQRKAAYAAMASKKDNGGASSKQSFTATTGSKKRTNSNRGVILTLKQARRAEANVRQAEHDLLTTQQKIDKLDKLFGKGLGANKERSKLVKRLIKEETKPEKPFTPFGRNADVLNVTAEDITLLEGKAKAGTKATKVAGFKEIYSGKGSVPDKQKKKEANDQQKVKEGKNGSISRRR